MTKNGAGALTTAVLAGSGFSLTAADTWQQNWNISPVSDANTLRNFQALYRRAVGTQDSNLKTEYQPAWIINKAGKLDHDPYASEPPHCVLCKNGINTVLKFGWVYWTTDLGWPVPDKMPPPGTPVYDLGHYGKHELYITSEDYRVGYLSEFVLFMLPNAGPVDRSKSGGGALGAAIKRNPLAPSVAPQSQGIIPQ